ncbi:MAG: formimidoylglutamate deiminase [Alphaproteobacteria bacterium]|nr:formimidoylglutamate deiminase [Alphaproteobacteria bacterium]
MSVIWAKQALLSSGWAEDVALEIGADGRIAGVREHQAPGGTRVDLVLPAPANSHSHAFQRAMAGLTERRGTDRTDSFWTWRRLMFRFLDRLTPDQVEAIAAFVQMEMLEAGFATNVEFHYLHHQPGGVPYDRLGEMSERIAAAAATTGIGLTLLPVMYQYGGCDRRALGPGQVRFGNDLERFVRLQEGARDAVDLLPPDTVLGVAPHSLRAVGREDLMRMAEMAAGGPVHMHLAEQIAEVEEISAAWGARPVEWALQHLDPGPNWTMIHCTQMLPHETEGLARSGAVAGLCPLTEASLGDGIFDGVRWFDAGGKISIGSDSNIRISLAEELRQLDTSQRLRDHSRAALATADISTGRRIFEAACVGGGLSSGRGSGRIEVGAWADLLALDGTHPDLVGVRGDTAIDSFVFSGGNDMVHAVWSAGRPVVREGRHPKHDQIVTSYLEAVGPLRAEA